MRIALMICGGTFDSQESVGSGLGVDKNFDPNRYAPLLETVSRQEQFSGIELELVPPPFRIDSSQLIPRLIPGLIDGVQKTINQDRYYGLIVAFGTDTLCYIVPCVATALGRINKCVSFVSGMSPWHTENSDALQNLIDALLVIKSGHYRGTMMVSDRRVYPPCNIAKISHDALDPFREIKLLPRTSFKPLSEVFQEKLGRGLSVTKPYPANEIVSLGSPVCCDGETFISNNHPSPQIIQIQVFPGLSSDQILRFVGDDTKHVIFRCYANGTAPVSEAGIGFNLAEVTQRLSKIGVMSYAVSQQLGTVAPKDYKVCQEMEEAGCLYVTSFTPETLHGILLALSLAGIEPSEAQRRIRITGLQYC